MSSALLDSALRGRVIEPKSPQEMTESRHAAERTIGRKIPPFPREIQMYRDAGLEPPTS